MWASAICHQSVKDESQDVYEEYEEHEEHVSLQILPTHLLRLKEQTEGWDSIPKVRTKIVPDVSRFAHDDPGHQVGGETPLTREDRNFERQFYVMNCDMLAPANDLLLA